MKRLLAPLKIGARGVEEHAGSSPTAVINGKDDVACCPPLSPNPQGPDREQGRLSVCCVRSAAATDVGAWKNIIPEKMIMIPRTPGITL